MSGEENVQKDVQDENNDEGGGEPQLSEVEQLAQKIGWNPNHEGDDRNFVSAEDYILRSKEIQSTQTKQNKGLKKKVDDLTKGLNLLQQHNDTVYKVQVKALKSRVAELESRRKDAVEDGDNAAVSAIDTQIKEIREIPEELPVEKIESGPSDEFVEWLEHNDWYRTDEGMKVYADKIGEDFAKRGLPEAKVFELVTKEVKKVFSENFEQKKPTPKVPPVESGGQRGTGRTVKSKYSYSDLSREQKDACDLFVSQGAMTREQYIKDLETIEKNQGRV
jgi:hypothetical protein